MKVLFAVGKGLVAYGVSIVYIAHLLAAGTAVKAAKDALGEPNEA